MKYPRLYHTLKTFVFSTIIFIALFYPIGLIHETGHAVICVSQGETFPWDWFFLKLSVVCDPLPSPPELFWSMGGIFGLVASIIPIIIFKRIRTHRILLGGFVGSSVFQFLYAIAEGWLHYSYMGNDSPLFLSITIVVLLSIFYFSRKVDKSIKSST